MMKRKYRNKTNLIRRVENLQIWKMQSSEGELSYNSGASGDKSSRWISPKSFARDFNINFKEKILYN